jgi:membrane peptidoglycan carboxypeptidase
MSRGKRIGRRIALLFTWLLGLFALMATLLVFAFYSVAHVPSPDTLVTNQTATILYSDGSVMATVGAENRTNVPLSKVPKHVRDAVIAAEDRGFYSDPGISVKGTLRAGINDVRGGSTQGGSGITQQYVKNAYLSSDQTLGRKLKELAIALKLSREFSKDEILEYYLNTIYFGRATYGIEAASQAYFGVSVDKVSVAQGALLAAVIKSPSYYEPRVNPQQAKSRWQYVVDGMVTTKKLPEAQALKLVFPKTKPVRNGGSDAVTGPTAHIVQQIKQELEIRDGISEAALNTKGLRIQTTIDRKAQQSAESAISEVYSGLPQVQANMRKALVAVNPANGGVLAYYGGPNSSKQQLDYAQAWRPPGSTFKPYVTATALAQNIRGIQPAYSIQSVFDGTSPQTIGGQVFENDPSDPSSGHYSLVEATTLSLNTVFGKLTSLVKADNVVATAHAMGIPEKQTATGPNPGAKTLIRNGTADNYVGIGNYPVRPIDQAVGFATFAGGGVRHDAYFVQKVTDAKSVVLYEHKDTGKRVLDAKVASDSSLAMQQVASRSGIAPADGRDVAAKTGTVGIFKDGKGTLDASDGWTVGYTPQVSVASWVGSDKVEPIFDADGSPEYGRDMAGRTWQAFMDAYLQGQPSLQLPDQQLITEGSNLKPKPVPSTLTPTSTEPTTTAPSTTEPKTTVAPTTTATATTTVPSTSSANPRPTCSRVLPLCATPTSTRPGPTTSSSAPRTSVSPTPP